MKKYIKETLKYLLRTRPFIGKYEDEIEAMYAMSPEELRNRNERRFLEIFRTAYAKSPFYRQLYRNAGISVNDIKRLEDISKLPVITKDMIKAHGEEMLTRNKWGLLKNHTSGTTGTPLTVYEDWPAIWREQAYFVCYRKRCGYNYGEPLVSLRGNLSRSDISLKIHISNTLFLSSYNINAGTAETYHRLIEKHRPKAIEGYPSSLYNLALVLRDIGLECRIPVAFTSSETLLDHQRELIEQVFHTQIYDHYGTTERSIRLEEAFDHNGYFEDPGYGIEEYYDDHVISTSLINDTFPLIRYRTDDRIVQKEGTAKTEGNLIDRIQGRSEDFLICKDGTRLMRLDFLFKNIPHVKQSQLVQDEIGMLEIRVVPDADFNDSDESLIAQKLTDRTGAGNLDYRIRRISEQDLIYTPNGKFKFLVSAVHLSKKGNS